MLDDASIFLWSRLLLVLVRVPEDIFRSPGILVSHEGMSFHSVQLLSGEIRGPSPKEVAGGRVLGVPVGHQFFHWPAIRPKMGWDVMGRAPVVP